MRYLAKFDDIQCLREFAKNKDVDVVEVMDHLLILAFDYDEDIAIYSIDELKSYNGVKSISMDTIVSLRYKKEKDTHTIKANEFSKKETTEFGTISNEKEYFTHLEVLSTRGDALPETPTQENAPKETHDYSPIYSGKNVNCFVIDTGVNSDNFFIKNKVFKTNFGINLEGMNQEDNDGHGTLSAMLIAGSWMGVAKEANIYTLKVLKSNGEGTTDHVVSAINNVIAFHESNSNPSIINLSLGGTLSGDDKIVDSDETNINNTHDNKFNDAVKVALSKGIHVVLAAGNGFLGKEDQQGERAFYGPIMSKFGNGFLNLSKEETDNQDDGQGDAIVVGSQDSNSNLHNSTPSFVSSFSNYGSGNTIFAVGGNQVLPVYTTESIGSGVDWKTVDGTSFSAPVITGLLALYLEKNPNATPAQGKAWLKESASDKALLNLKTHYTTHEDVEMKVVYDGNDKLDLTFTDSNLKWEFSDPISSTLITVNAGKNIQLNMESDDTEFGEFFSANKEKSFGIWKVLSITNNSISLERIDLSNLSLDIYDKTINVKKITFSLLLNTSHESKDGIISWQMDSQENRLIDAKTGSSFQVDLVDETDNLTAFNPFQTYTLLNTLDNQSELDISKIGDLELKSKLKLVTDRIQSPFEETYELKAGSLPSGITLNSDGTISKSDTFVSNKSKYDDVVVLVKTDYAESLVELSVVDSSISQNEFESNLTTDALIYYGSCETGSVQFDLSLYKSEIKEVFQIDERKAIVWRNDVPDNVIQPFSKLYPGHLYYIKIESGKTIKIPGASTQGQNQKLIVSTDCEI